jgi:tetratricopeptide (TPR) repeat protein
MADTKKERTAVTRSAFNRRWKDRVAALGIFLGTAALYVWSCGPGLTAYRDTGEMAVVLNSLGVAHPPGYPLYIVIGSVFTHLVPGSLCLRANYFSALAAAAAVAAMYLFLRRWCRPPAAIFGALLLAFYRPFWELASVSEMYALGVFWVIFTLDASLVRRNAPLAGLLFGLGLGVRIDTVILAPAIFYPFIRDRRALLHAVGFAAVGATIFLYMPLRSAADPWIDWGDPETLPALFRSLSRKSYGGSLDLLSQSYHAGQNLWSSWSLLGGSIGRYLGAAGAAGFLVGFVRGFRDPKDVWITSFNAFVLSGPVFLFLANLPPNPHAAAILEAAFVLPVIFVCILAAVGLEWVFTLRLGRTAAVACVALTLINGAAAAPEAVKRNAWALRDYSEAIFRSAPRSAYVVLREDVQLFSAWQAQLLERRRPDLTVVAVGLSASDWYWRMKERWPTARPTPISLKSADGYVQLIHGPRPVVAGYDTDIPTAAHAFVSAHGFLRELTPVQVTPIDADILEQVSLFRDNTVRFPKDFFTADLKADASRAYVSHALEALRAPTLAEKFLRKAQTLDPDYPDAVSDRAYLCLASGRYDEALRIYQQAESVSRDLLRRSVYYKSLPELVGGLKRALAETLDHEGVCFERLGRVEDARARYGASISIQPTAFAHYNLGVTYWGRDWDKAIENFEKSAAIDPNATQAAMYLMRARQMGKKG